jgi:hypothetical protein
MGILDVNKKKIMDFFLKIKVSKKEEQKNKDILDGGVNLNKNEAN